MMILKEMDLVINSTQFNEVVGIFLIGLNNLKDVKWFIVKFMKIKNGAKTDIMTLYTKS